MKTFTVLLATITAIFFAGICRGQEEPVKPAQEQAPQLQAPPQADEAPQPPVHREQPAVTHGDIREIQGEISSLQSQSLAVNTFDEATGAENEMLFTFDPKKVSLDHVRSLAEIHPGDYVLVRYREEIKDYGDRQESMMKPVTIRFIKPGDDKSHYKKRAGEEFSDLPLKGVK